MGGGQEGGGGARDSEGGSAPAGGEQQGAEREERSGSEQEGEEAGGAKRSGGQRGAAAETAPSDGEQGQSDASGGEQAQDDVEMNSSSGNEAGGSGGSATEAKQGSKAGKKAGRAAHHHGPSSTTGSSSSKSSKSVTGSSSCGSSQHTETSGSEPAEPRREQTHKEMMQTVQEMKKRLPSERRSHSKPSTVEALNYALNCVKQVQANSEYYKLLMSHCQEERQDATVCSLEELDNITSEHALKNTDSFVVVFSLTTGRVVYASEQASSILNCKRRFLESAKFVELLYHQDVNVFYTHTAQPHLPPWNVGTDSNAILFECAQVKSFFCRIRGGKDRDGEMRYNPFRFTPYLLKVQGLEETEQQSCCLALAERIISGYEAPRIPMDKRIFTTTHSPGCVFLEVDDRAVPLLGYLPQDLIGTSLLTCLHPEDRALMPAMHRKILQYAGQPPFEHSPIRFRCQNGDYVTLDTSWSSFVNPWSRKVAFIIGRHKVRTGPLNEDVFAARSKSDIPVVYEDIKELQAIIYKLFLQPVHNNGSSGYGSLGSNGSHEHYISVASSSDSNGNLWEDSHREPVTLQQICANVNKVKNWGQQAYLDSRSKLVPLGKTATEPRAPHNHAGQTTGVRGHAEPSLDESRKQPHIPSYQQINCVDSIIRYLESCTTPGLKRKSESLSIATSSSSSSSEEDKALTAPSEDVTNPNAGTLDSQISAGSAVTVAHTTAAVVGAPLTDIDLSTKAMSVVSVTSQCSYSSTIVHVPQPESEVTALEDAPMGSEPTDQTPTPTPTPARTAPSSAAAEEFRVVGLTKEVLSAHTQKEEQEYVDRFRHRILQSPYSSYLQQDNGSLAHSHHRGDCVVPPLSAGGLKSKSGKPKHKRPKPQDSSDSYGSPPGTSRPAARRPPNPPQSSWPSSESSQPQPSNVGYPMPPLVMPIQPPTPYFHMMGQMGGAPPKQGGPVAGLPMMQPDQAFQQMQQMQQAQGLNPYMTPVMAVILPNFPAYPPGYPMFQQSQPMTPFNMAAYAPVAPTPFPLAGLVPQQPQQQQQQQQNLGCVPGVPVATGVTPQPWLGEEDLDGGQPPALFSSSRSSSPLQLNLLQEELPKLAEPQSSTGRPESLHEQHTKGEDAPSDLGNQDALSTSSELLDLLMHEDARSGTGSNASGSGSGESGGSLGSGSGSGSNGTSTSHTGSSNSSKYFASNDSSDTSRKARKSQEAQERAPFEHGVENSLWTMIQHTPEPVMMTYQIHPRDQTQVLKEDREKLLLLQPLQPWFTQEQREELAEVHPWIHQHGIPQEIDTQGCVTCSTMDAGPGSPQTPSPPAPDSSMPQEDTPQEPNSAPNT